MADDLAERLLCTLRSLTGRSTLQYAATPARLTGGFWAELLSFELRNAPAGWEGPLVARVMPEPAVAQKETVVQAAAADNGVPTPRVRGAGGPDAGLGRAFLVMDRVDGQPLLAGLDSATGLIGAPRRLWRMPDLLARAMAALHEVEPEVVRAQLDCVEGVAQTVPEMLEHLAVAAAANDRPDLVAASNWLLAHPIDAGDDVICHGDLHPYNVLLADDGAMTILDWSASLLAPRAYDVAFTSLILSNPPVDIPGPVRPLVRGAGRGLARRFLARYRRRTGYSFDRRTLDWFQAVVCMRALTEVAGWIHDGDVGSRAGHPWLLSAGGFADRLRMVTSAPVRPL
jgi:aminoglycoside phosphotransferase (APT) family kinase protein